MENRNMFVGLDVHKETIETCRSPRATGTEQCATTA